MKVRKAVFPVAGWGTRFLPATKAMPKEMLPLVDKPIIQYVVEECLDSGVKSIIMVTGRVKRAIEDHFDISFELESVLKGQGKEGFLKEVRRIALMADMIYVRQKQPLGLGHAILSAKEAVGDEPFAVLLGDDVIYDPQKSTLARMLEIYERYNRPVIAIREVPGEQVVRYGIVGGKVLGGGVVEISSMVEKPSVDVAPSNWAIIGRYVLPPETFDYIEETKMGPTGEIHLTDALSRLLHDGPVYGYLFPGTYLDCGEKLGYLKAMIYYSMLREDLSSALREFMREFLK
jgi:UTP--glucose-1-phosphate uridylyltransferase